MSNSGNSPTNPLVSIIVVTYNHEKFIGECIRGIIKQNISFKIEVIIGDDCSTDMTQKVIEKEVSKNQDPNKTFRLLFHQQNLSSPPHLPGKRNFFECYKQARGKYIALCEGDDYWTNSHKLQRQVDFLRDNDCYSLVHHPVQYVDESNKMIHQKRRAYEINDTNDLARYNGIMTCTAVFRSDAFNIPSWYDQILMGDWVNWLLLSQKGKIQKIEDSMACYRVHSGGLWSGKHFEKDLKIKIQNVKKLDKYLGYQYHQSFKDSIKYFYFEFYKSSRTKNDLFFTTKYLIICLLNLKNPFYSFRDLLYILRKY